MADTISIQTQLGTVKILMLKGEQGIQGEIGTFEQLTQEQQDEIAEYVGGMALAASLESKTGTYVTTGDSTIAIEVPIVGFTSDDILFVFVEGLCLIEGIDYTVSGSTITLAQPITHSGTTVQFRALHATWGSS